MVVKTLSEFDNFVSNEQFFKLKAGKREEVTLTDFKSVEKTFIDNKTKIDKKNLVMEFNIIHNKEVKVWTVSSKRLLAKIKEILLANKGVLPVTIEVVSYGSGFETEYEVTQIEHLHK